MFHDFMQMGGPAAFAIFTLGAGPAVVLIVLIVNRTIQRGQQLKQELDLQQQAYNAKQITEKALTRRDDG